MNTCYIVRHANDKLLCFYYQKGSGILCRMFERNKWSKPYTILENSRDKYSITIEKGGNLYLFCQHHNGDVVLCTNKDDVWTNKIILKNQSKTVYTILFNAMMTDNGLSLIYNLPAPEEKSSYLVSQQLNNGQWSQASRIDKFIESKPNIYTIQRVSAEHMLLYYQTRTPENNLGYREVTPEQNSAYNIFHTTPNQIVDSSYLTTNNSIHVAYVTKSMFSFQLTYRKKETEQFTNPKVLCETQNIENCLIFIANDNLYITFMNNGQLYFTISEDKGSTFSKLKKYKNKFCLNPCKAIYLSESNQEENKYFLRELYVDYENPWDIQIIPDLYYDFYSFPEGMPPLKTEQNKTVINNEEVLDLVERLKNQLSIAKIEISDKDNKIEQLTNLLKSRNEDIVKLHHDKKDIIERFNSEIKQLESKLSNIIQENHEIKERKEIKKDKDDNVEEYLPEIEEVTIASE